MDIENVPGQVWDLLAAQARQAAAANQPVLGTVDDYFYDHIYRRWTADFNPINYQSNQQGVIDVGWADLARQWAPGSSAKAGPGDQSKGLQAMQADAGDPSHRGTRLGEKYSNQPTVSRFQFLVGSGGGIVLLNRMRRACQLYIAQHRGTVVQWWKVFGESFAEQGQSDACVVYLLKPYDDPLVLEFIDGYLWPNIRDIVNDRFVPVGLVRIGGRPLWATWIPSRSKWSNVFGAGTLNTHYGSAGGLMGLVFGNAFARAVRTRTALDNVSNAVLITAAKIEARRIIRSLE
ncbi:hypothetical protein [Piscinibacter sakaiensis]|uniref:hypothetical protein n=1 Tax=Piscinibacter sakaiensis TaxID=1547922 RepID=UPI003AAEDCF8